MMIFRVAVHDAFTVQLQGAGGNFLSDLQRDGLFVEEPISKSLQSQRDGLFVEELIPKSLQSQRDGLFVEELIPKSLQSSGTACSMKGDVKRKTLPATGGQEIFMTSSPA
jgi:hypothetical protein